MIVEYIKNKLKTSFGKDVLYTLLGQIAVMICLLIVTKVLSNNLTIDGFAQYNIIKRSSSVIAFVLLGGMGIALPRYLAISRVARNAKKVRITIITSLTYIFIISLSTLLVYILLKSILCKIVTDSTSWNAYLWIFAYSFACSITSFFYAYLRGLDRFKDFNIIQILINIILLAPLLSSNYDAIDIFKSWTIIYILLIVILLFREFKIYNKIHISAITRFEYLSKFKELSIYSSSRMIGDFFLFAFSAFPLLYISKENSLIEVSYFSVGITIFTLATPIFSFLGVILLPLVSRLMTENRYNEANYMIKKLQTIYLIIALLITIIFVCGIKTLIVVFFSPEYLPAASISKILIFSILPSSLYYLYRNPIDAASVFPYNLIILVFCFALLVVGFIISKTLIQYAYVYLATTIAQGFLSWLAWKKINKSFKNNQLSKL